MRKRESRGFERTLCVSYFDVVLEWVCRFQECVIEAKHCFGFVCFDDPKLHNALRDRYQICFSWCNECFMVTEVKVYERFLALEGPAFKKFS